MKGKKEKGKKEDREVRIKVAASHAQHSQCWETHLQRMKDLSRYSLDKGGKRERKKEGGGRKREIAQGRKTFCQRSARALHALRFGLPALPNAGAGGEKRGGEKGKIREKSESITLIFLILAILRESFTSFPV